MRELKKSCRLREVRCPVLGITKCNSFDLEWSLKLIKKGPAPGVLSIQLLGWLMLNWSYMYGPGEQLWELILVALSSYL